MHQSDQNPQLRVNYATENEKCDNLSVVLSISKSPGTSPLGFKVFPFIKSQAYLYHTRAGRSKGRVYISTCSGLGGEFLPCQIQGSL